MPTHAKHAVKKLKKFEFFKINKKYLRSKYFKKSIWKLGNGYKNNHNTFFIFDLALKKPFLAQAQHALTQNFRGKKTLKS
jgi:hypothetical protein